MESSQLFWPISRAILRDVDNNTTAVHRLRSLITYQLLFGGRLVIRDSDYVNAWCFRGSIMRTLSCEATDHETFFRQVIDDDPVSIAHREGSSLGEVATHMSEAGRSPVVPADFYTADAPDLRYLDCECMVGHRSITYSLENASEYYTRQIRNLLNQSLEPYIDDDFRRRAADRVDEYLLTHPAVGWGFFRGDGGFWNGLPAQDRDKHEHFVDFVLGQARTPVSFPTSSASTRSTCTMWPTRSTCGAAGTGAPRNCLNSKPSGSARDSRSRTMLSTWRRCRCRPSGP